MASDFYDKLIQTRHHIHQHPEISGEEIETTAFIKAYLLHLGIRLLDLPLKTGLVAEIGSGQPIVALRADIDALPIKENTGLAFASSNNVMHACGHDFHQTSLLGAAELLKAQEDQLKGTVRLLFQPAEEIFQGAHQMIDAGALDGVSAIIGYHNNPHLKPGQIGLRTGAIMAGVEQFKVTVTGVSVHAARPDLGVDTVLAITTMVTNLQAIVARTVSPFDSAVVSVAHISVGNTWNVLPAQGFFEGTIRTFDPEVCQRTIDRFTTIIESVANQLSAQVTIDWGNSPGVTFNDAELTPIVFEASKTFAEVVEPLPSTGSEDFATYQEKIPGVFASVGSNGDPGAPDWHHDDFIVKDEALETAVNYYVHNAVRLLDYLSQK